MKKLHIILVAIFISLSIFAFTNLQVKAIVTLSGVASASPSAIEVGDSSVLSASISGGSGTYTYQWSVEAPGATAFSDVTTNGHAATYTFATLSSTVLGDYKFEVSVTDVNFPFGTGTSSPATVTVNSVLAAPTITADPTIVDRGQTSSLTSTAVSTGTSPYTYQWLQKAPGAGSYSSISGATTSSYSFVTSDATATGAWSFELKVTDSDSNPVVVTSTAASVTVNTAPTVTVSPTSWTMDAGQQKTFSATPTGGSGSYTGYQWYVGGVAQSGKTSSTFNYSPSSAGSYSITVTVTDSLGSTSARSAAATVAVAASPTVSITPIGPLTLDVGLAQQFSATHSGGSGSLSYQWYLDGSVVGTNSASYSYTASGTSHSVTCKVTDSASTPVTSPSSNAVTITVNSALVPPTVTASPGTVNQGQISSLTSTAVSTGTSPYTYQWFEAAPDAKSYTAVGSSSTSFSFVTSNSTTTGSWSFYLRVTDNLGAAINSTAVSITVDSDTLDHFLLSSIGNQVAGTPFSITITAKGPSNNTLTSFTGTNTLSVSIGTINPVNTGTFVGGVWTGSVTLTGVGSSVTITTVGSGMSGTSGSFAVIPGVLDHFVFSNISTQKAGSAFSITVTAEDASNNIVTSYTGIPSLAYSAGSISPTTMNAFISGVGSASVTVTAAGSGVTITANDGTHTGTSNTFTVTLAPTPIPTATSSSSPGASPTSTPTKPGTTPTPNPSSIPTPIATTVTAMTGSGKTVELKIRGNVTNLQISNAIISSYQSTKTTLVSFAVTGPSGTVGFVNMSIPKTAIFIASPEVYIDGSQDTNQGYTQDSNNFYVWFITSFSTHNVLIQFVASSKSSGFLVGPLFAVGITVPGIISVFTVIAVRRLNRKPDEA